MKRKLNSTDVMDDLTGLFILREAQILVEEWRKHYNTKKPNSALGYRPPAPESIVPMDHKPIMH